VPARWPDRPRSVLWRWERRTTKRKSFDKPEDVTAGGPARLSRSSFAKPGSKASTKEKLSSGLTPQEVVVGENAFARSFGPFLSAASAGSDGMLSLHRPAAEERRNGGPGARGQPDEGRDPQIAPPARLNELHPRGPKTRRRSFLVRRRISAGGSANDDDDDAKRTRNEPNVKKQGATRYQAVLPLRGRSLTSAPARPRERKLREIAAEYGAVRPGLQALWPAGKRTANIANFSDLR